MSLDIEPRSGDFAPWLKFNGKAGRWYNRNDSGEEVEVTDLTAIIDLENIKLGFIYFAEGEAPQTVWDTNGVRGSKPPGLPKAKRGFSVNVFAPKLGGLREFSSTSNGAIIAIRDLYDNQFENAAERRAGKVPVVRCERVLPVKSKFGTNYEPALKIVKWVERPPGLALTQAKPEPATNTTTAPKAAPKNDFDVGNDLDDDIPF